MEWGGVCGCEKVAPGNVFSFQVDYIFIYFCMDYYDFCIFL